MSVNERLAAAQPTGERRLHDPGHAQESRRPMSGFSNLAVSFTIISILRRWVRRDLVGAPARNWFTGPKVQGTPEELAGIERDLAGMDV